VTVLAQAASPREEEEEEEREKDGSTRLVTKPED
jgi:hypothetical protein